MPMRPPSPCGKAGCREYASKKGRCDEHQIEPWKHTKSRHERGYDARWYKLRKIALERDSHLCQTCKRDGIYTKAVQVDHIKPKYLGGSNDLSNLESICDKCHKLKTQKEAKEARNG
jgi:5-methylcytosine-specific restriction protein A